MKSAQFPEISGIFPIFPANFLKIYRILAIFCNSSWNSDKNWWKFYRKIASIFWKNEMKCCSFHFIRAKFWTRFLLKFWDLSGAKGCKSCRSRKMLQNEPLVAIVAVDAAENEPLKIWGDLFIISIVGDREHSVNDVETSNKRWRATAVLSWSAIDHQLQLIKSDSTFFF